MLKRLALKFLTSFGTAQPEIVNIPVYDIKVRPVHQLETDKITPLFEAYNKACDHQLPPIVVMKINNEYYLFDGQHRLVLRAYNGHYTIPAVILSKDYDHNVHLYTHDVRHLLEHLEG